MFILHINFSSVSTSLLVENAFDSFFKRGMWAVSTLSIWIFGNMFIHDLLWIAKMTMRFQENNFPPPWRYYFITYWHHWFMIISLLSVKYSYIFKLYILCPWQIIKFLTALISCSLTSNFLSVWYCEVVLLT